MKIRKLTLTITRHPDSYEWGNVLKQSVRHFRALLKAGDITQEEYDIRWRNLLEKEQAYLLANPR